MNVDQLLQRGLAERARGDSGELLTLVIRAAETIPQRRRPAWNAGVLSRRLLIVGVAMIVLAALIGAIVLGLRPPNPVLPFVPHANGEIVAPGDGCSLVAVDPSTGQSRPFFAGVPNCFHYSGYELIWNPTGTLIAFNYTFNCGGCGSAEAKAAIAAKVDGLWVLDPASLRLRKLTRGADAGAIDDLAWSPDGLQIAYVNGNEIWVVSVAGGPARQLSAAATVNTYPTWSPDSHELAWIAEVSDQPGVMILDVNGGAPTRVFDATGGVIAGIDWARDGRSIVVSTDIGNGTLRVVDPAGSESIKVSLPRGATIPYARRSPDGSRIAFEAVVTAPDSPTTPTTLLSAEVWTMAADGSDRRRLFAAASPLDALSDVSWSPDGRFVIFSVIPIDGTNLVAGASYVAAEDGSGFRRVGDVAPWSVGGATVPVPAWQPLPVPTKP